MTEFKPFISVVVPIYKTEKYLKQCVDSLIAQDYDNMEILLIDDGSPDLCPQICDDYEKLDVRIRVFHKENGGLASVRKFGIENVYGDYVMLVDSDDWIADNTISECVKRMSNSTDLVLFPYNRVYTKKTYPVHIFNNDCVFIGSDFYEKIYKRFFGLTGKELRHPELADSIVPVCMKIYRKSIIQQGRFFDLKDVGSCDDGLFNVFACSNVKEAVYIDIPFYNYRKSVGATSTYRPNFVNQWNNLFNIMQSVIDEKKLPNDFQIALNNRIALSSIGIGMNEFSNTNVGFNTHVKNIRSYLKSERYKNCVKQLKTKDMPLKWKVFMFCCKHRLAFFVTFMLQYMKHIKRSL